MRQTTEEENEEEEEEKPHRQACCVRQARRAKVGLQFVLFVVGTQGIVGFGEADARQIPGMLRSTPSWPPNMAAPAWIKDCRERYCQNVVRPHSSTLFPSYTHTHTQANVHTPIQNPLIVSFPCISC